MDPSVTFDQHLDNLPNDQPDENRATPDSVEERSGRLFAAATLVPPPVEGEGISAECVRGASVSDRFGLEHDIPPFLAPAGSPSTQAVQRGIDVVVSAVSLLFFLPLFLLISLAIKLDSRGPVLFAQERVGYRGTSFKMYKFRSMVRDAERLRAELWTDNERDGPVFKMKNDPRITRIGHMLRKYSLDELPQIINVLKGEMTLVGPRPALPFEVEMYSARQRGRLAVVPGLTGLWQISGRANVSFEQSVDLDLEYIRTQSIRLNLRIILLTIPKVLSGDGAY